MNWMTAEQALGHLRSGMRVFIGSGCAAPQRLVGALVKRGHELFDVEIIHILTFAGAPYARRELLANFRHNAFFIGPNVRDCGHVPLKCLSGIAQRVREVTGLPAEIF